MLIKQKENSTHTPSRVNMVAAAVLTVGLAFSAMPANAYIPRGDQVSIRVNPVDLETQRGIQRVYEYMTQEATNACDFAGVSLKERRIEAQCTAELLEDFVFDLNDKRLIDFHNAQISA